MDQPTAERGLHELEPLVEEWTLQARSPDSVSVIGCDGPTARTSSSIRTTAGSAVSTR